MLYVIIGEDRPGTLDQRMAARPCTMSSACRHCKPKAA
jgi:hypothetical protein